MEFSASVGFIHKESVTMHGHTIVNVTCLVPSSCSLATAIKLRTKTKSNARFLVILQSILPVVAFGFYAEF